MLTGINMSTPKNKSKTCKMDGNSLNPQKELLELLQKRFSEIFTEGKIDGDKLKQTLGEDLDTNNERYGLSWAGKADCFRHIQETTTATLIPRRNESVDFDKTENIFIEGDNLEVLKILQKTYQNKIKMIYIDPPYNTGNDSFIYPDRYKEEKEDYEMRAGIKDAEGLLTKDGFWRKNSKDAGHFHSNWLSMMYPRLFLARNLLRSDGGIFISIGQDEISNLIHICNDIFGEENRISICTRLMKTGGQKGKFFSPNTDYVLIYAKSIDVISNFKDVLSEDLINKVYTQVQDSGPRKGENFREMGLFQPTLDIRANQRYYIRCPDGTFAIPPGKTFPDNIAEGSKSKPVDGDGVWRWTYDQYKKEFLKGNIVFKETDASPLITANKKRCRWNIYTKIWLKDRLEKGKLPLDIFDKFENRHSAQELNKLSIPFDFAKPSNLISYLIGLCDVSDNDIVLDFFAGSCTTAHAVMALNAEDGGNRKFICVQLAEPCEEESEAFKAGFKTIADIGKERIRRAGKKIKKEIEGNLKFDKNRLDLGFKIFRLEESNFKQWRI